MPTTGRGTRANLSLAGLAAQNIANRLTAGSAIPNRGAAMFPVGGRASAATNNFFGSTRRKRRKLVRKVRKIAKRKRSSRTSFRKLTKGSNAAKRHMAALRKLRKKRR